MQTPPSFTLPPLWRWPLALLAGGLTVLLGVFMFPPWDGAEAAYVWLIPLLLWMLTGPTKKQIWLVGFGTGWLHWTLLISWLRHSPSAVDLPGAWALGWGMTLALAGVVAVFFAIWVRLAAWLVPLAMDAKAPRRLLTWAALAGLWILLEWLRSWVFTGFPWLPVAASQWQRPLILQILSVTGTAGLSFLLIYFNLAIAAYFRHLLRTNKKPWWQRFSPEFYSALGLLAIAIFFGLNALAERQTPQPLLRAAFVQPDLAPSQRWDPARAQAFFEDSQRLLVEAAIIDAERSTDSLRALLQLTPTTAPDHADSTLATAWEHFLPGVAVPVTNLDTLLTRRAQLAATWPGNADVILWPEVSLPVTAVADGTLDPVYTRLTADAQRPILQGAITRTGEDYYNAVVLTEPGDLPFDAARNVYRKRRLVPFGEYVPLARALPFLQTIVPIPGSFAAGDEAKTIPVFTLDQNRVRLGPLICYEDVYPTFARATIRAGADALFVATNNAWFGPGAGSTQHAAHAVLRAVETRRPVLRVGNAGWSGWIDAYGYVRWHMVDPLTEEMAFRGVDMVAVTRDPTWRNRLSAYTRWGDWPMLALALMLTLAVFFLHRTKTDA